MPREYWRPAGAVVAALAATLSLGLGACNSSSGPANPSLTAAQADSVGEVVAMDADGEIDGSTTTGGGTSYQAQIRPPSLGLDLATVAYQCTVTRTPTSPVDTDHDGVPDSVLFTFTNCVLSLPLESDSLSGAIAIVDPTPSVADHAAKQVFVTLRHARLITATGKHTAETVNGARSGSRDSTKLALADLNLQTVYLFGDGSTATHVRNWASTFTADVAGSIKPDTRLPSGTWNISGMSSWTRGANSWSLAVTTSPALHYNATCTMAPRFDAGTLVAVVTQGAMTSTLTVVFTACGAYSVTKS